MIYPISWEFSWPYLLTALLVGYTLGSIPFGVIFTKWSGEGNLRNIGSGSIGATNVLRTGRKGIAAATLLADIFKGITAVFIGSFFGLDVSILAGLGAILGHMFSVWIKFKGGKGVATALGIVLILSWKTGLIVFTIWLLTATILRYSSLAALLASLTLPFVAWAIEFPQLIEFFGLLTVLIWFRHQGNIRRLLQGQEPKIGKK